MRNARGTRSLLVAALLLGPFALRADPLTAGDPLTPAPYSRIKDEGTNLVHRRALNFVGSGVTCVDDAVNKMSTCTIGGSAGVSTTAVTGGYMTAVTGNIPTADTTNPSVQICNTNDLGAGATALMVYQNANCTAPVFSVGYDGGIGSQGNLVGNFFIARAGKSFTTFSGPAKILGADATGGTAVGVVFDNSSDLTTAGDLAASFRVNAVQKAGIGKDGQLVMATGGAAAVQGTATLSTGVATVATTAVSATSRIHLTMNTPGGTAIGVPFAKTADIVAGTSFIIRSFAPGGTTAELGDNSTVNWLISDQ